MHWIERGYKLTAACRAVQARAGAVQLDRGVIAKQNGKSGQLYIYDFIGESFMWGSGVTDKSVAAELKKLGNVDTLDIYINSEGGSVVDGKAIYNLLKRFEAKKVVHIDGLAASAASFIAMVGDQIVIAENAEIMMHEAFGIDGGNAAAFINAAKMLDRENALIAGMYAARTGKPAAEFWARAPSKTATNGIPDLEPSTGLMAEETWLTADQAVALRLADVIDRNSAPIAAVADASLAEKIPALRIATETERRNVAARTRQSVLVDQAQSILQDRNRASPVRNSQSRPAARTNGSQPIPPRSN